MTTEEQEAQLAAERLAVWRWMGFGTPTQEQQLQIQRFIAESRLEAARARAALPPICSLSEGEPLDPVEEGNKLIAWARFWLCVPLVGWWFADRAADQLDSISDIIERRA